MDSLFKKFDELSDLLKQFNASIKISKPKSLMPPKTPQLASTTPLKTPKPGSLPKMPNVGVAPASKKDPVKVINQLKNKDTLKAKTNMMKFSTSGQWSLK